MLAGGKLRLDEPAPHVARLTIDNPEKRNALDHDILDALAATLAAARRALPAADRARARSSRPATTSARCRADGFARARPRRSSRTRSPRRSRRSTPTPIPCSPRIGRPRDRRRARAGAVVRPARLQRRRAARDAAGAAGAGLLAHGAAQVRRRDRRAAHARAVLHRAQHRRARRRSAGGWSARSLPAAEVAARGVELAAEIAANAPLSLAGNKRVIGELLAARGRLDPAVEEELVALRDACFGSEDFLEGVRAFAEKRPPRWHGPLTNRASHWVACAGSSSPSCCCSSPAPAAHAMPIDGPPVVDAGAGRRPADRLARLARGRRARTPAGSSRGVQLPGRGSRLLDLRLGHAAVAEPVVAALGHRPARAHGARRARRPPRRAPRRRRASASPTCRARAAATSAGSFGGLGHASHQNGLDVDILYPRIDRARAARVQAARSSTTSSRRTSSTASSRRRASACSPARACRCAARAGSSSKLAHHDDHLHVRIR